MDKLLYQIALTKIPLVGPRTAKNLISYCGGVKEIFSASAKQLRAIPGIGTQVAQNIRRQRVLQDAAKELKFIEKNQIKTLFYLDQAYPFRLKKYPDCPILLYYSGTAELNHPRIVAMVGTRRPNPYGITACQNIVSELKSYQVLVISGLAYGIDITAHRRCLEEDIPTIGVLGHGLSQVYPRQHERVAQRMKASGGLLTEYTSQTTPEREHFPMRNRIIAGLCDALVVVQTAEKGGSIISAEMAHAYHKDVFAIPGRINDAQSQGCNQLIKQHKATLVESAADIAFQMGWEQNPVKAIQQSLFVELSREEQSIIALLNRGDAISIDQLRLEAKLGNSQMAALLLNLEFKGMIRTLPGKRYALA